MIRVLLSATALFAEISKIPCNIKVFSGLKVVLLHHYYTSESRCDKNFEIEVRLMENKKNINNIEYVLVGDYYIPDLKLPNEERPIGKYGRMHREYLKEHNPMMFNDLVLEGQLWTYLADLNEQAENRLQFIISRCRKRRM